MNHDKGEIMAVIKLCLRVILGYLYTAYRKRCHVETDFSVTTYHYTAQVDSTTRERFTVHFHSHQNRHHVKAKHWWMPNLTYSTYRVVAEEYQRAMRTKCTEFTFPDTAPFFLKDTNYAHMSAIHAFIDDYQRLSA